MNALPEKGMIPDDASAVPRAARRTPADAEGVRLSIELDDSEEDMASARPADPFPRGDKGETGPGGDQDLSGQSDDSPRPARAARQAAAADGRPQPQDHEGRARGGAFAEPSGADALPPHRAGSSRAADSGSLVPPQLAGIEVTLSVEIGSHRLSLRDLLAVEPGQLFALDRMTDEPVDILVNGRPFARGEVVAIGERFGVRLVELSDPGN